MRAHLPLRPGLALLALGLAATATGGGVAAQAASPSDPFAGLPDKLIRAANAEDYEKSADFARQKVVDSMIELTGHGAHFSKVKGCEKSGPLRVTAQGRASTVTCSSRISNAEGAAGGFAFLSFRDEPGAKVFRVEYAAAQ